MVSNKKMRHFHRVLVCIPVLLIGGTEIQTLNLVRVLLSNGYHVSICCFYEYNETMVSLFRSEGVKVLLLGLKRTDGMLRLLRKMKSVFNEIRPDIVHVQYIAPGLIPIIAARLSYARTVFATVHQPSSPYGFKAKLFLRLGAYLSTVFFCVSKSAEESWFGNSEVFNPQYVNHKRKHFTIYNAVDISMITYAIDSSNCDQLKKSLGLDACSVIGIVGRLRKEKGQAFLLDAMRDVIKEVPEAKLVVVGDGPDWNQLIERSKTLGIADHILWLGAKNPGEALQLYGIMDVVAVPSLFEGFSLTAAEAMAASVPVVASAVDGLNEVVEHNRTGFLVPPRDSNALAKCLLKLLSDPSKAKVMGKEGKQKAMKYFSMKHFSESITTSYLSFS